MKIRKDALFVALTILGFGLAIFLPPKHAGSPLIRAREAVPAGTPAPKRTPQPVKARTTFPAAALAVTPANPDSGPQRNSTNNPVLKEGLVTFKPELRQRAFEAANGEHLPFNVTLLDGQSVELTISSHDILDAESGILHAAAADEPGSHVLLAYVGDAVAGTMYFPQRGLYQVRYAGNGQHRVQQMDPTWSAGCAVGEMPPAPPDGSPAVPVGTALLSRGDMVPNAIPAGADVLLPSLPAVPLPEGDAPPVAADSPTTVDVFVAYTTVVKNANGGDAGTAALINSAIATANLAYNNSQAGVVLRLAGKTEVSYSESGDLSTDLTRMRTVGDGQLETIPTLRASNKADLYCLLVHSGGAYAGLAYLWTPSATSSSFAPWACSVVVDAYADGYLTLAHEIGHNLGCGHAPGDGGSGAYSYSVGKRFTANGTAYRTVMAYAPGTRIPYFSNPNVNYLGVATGGSTVNNAQTLINSKATLAAIMAGAPAALDWTPFLTADLNADSKPDLVWRQNATGRVISWYMDGTNTTGTAALWSGDAAWIPMASADLNADGKPDIIWRNSSSGRVVVWYLNGVTTTSTGVVWSGDPAWVPRATGDFNADGKPDILWRNSATGRVIVWYMNGVTSTGTAALWSGEAVWIPIATADLNNDGKPDILWRNSATGRVVVWFMNGVTQTGTAVLWSGDANWVPIATGDYNGDGKPDIVWRNSGSGRTIIWYMNGTTQTGTAIIWG